MDGHSKIEMLKAEGRLPSPKGAAMQVLLLCQQDDVTNQEVAHAIQADPALSVRLIKLANSPAAHQIRPVVSVVDAVAVLGMNTVRQMVLSLSLVDSSRNMACTKFDYQSFWSHSLLTAITAQKLFAHQGFSSLAAEEVFVLGLLGRVGSLALATAYPKEYAAILSTIEASQDGSLLALERVQFGFDHNHLSQEMMTDWRMPKAFRNAILHYEDPDKAEVAECSNDWCLLHLLHIADYLATTCLSPELLRSKMFTKLVFKATRLGVESDMLTNLGNQVVKEWHEWSALFGIKILAVPPFESLLDVAPLAPEPVDAGEMPQPTGNVSSYKLRVLLVDDDRAVLMMLKMLLDFAGHTVAVAQNGLEALEKVQEFKPQIILTDWLMPGMDGIAFCKALRSRVEWRNIYVFMMTAQESTDRLVEAFEAGADDYMTKPINPKILAARLSAGQRVVQLQEELEREREQLHKFSVELAASNKKLQQLALTDELTGLPNRRYANDYLVRQWSSAQRNATHLACMMVDIDYFKRVNDSYGHKIGDDVLKQVTASLQLSVRKQDVVCRLGGEEFVVICADVQPAMLKNYAERVRQSVADLALNDGAGKIFRLSVSIGTASKLPDLLSPDLLMQLADKRLYAAKEAGRNRVVSE